jgi:hypothetical protein
MEELDQIKRDIAELKTYVQDRKIQQLTMPLDEVTKRILGEDTTAVASSVISLGTPTELTISGGEITPTSNYHYVDTEGDAATDDLDTINTTGLSEGTLLVLRPESGSRDVVCKDNTGNLQLAGDFTMSTTYDSITLILEDGDWVELSRSDN